MKLKEEIVSWIKKKVEEANAKGIVVGLSGGVDSTVTAVLCKEAVGDNLLGLIMPCHSRHKDLEDALKVSKKFGIRTVEIELSGIYDELIKLYPPGDKISCSNIKPRLRMLTLYYFANSLNYLVCGTGNKSELMVGYFTKYGDGGVDILPLGGLLKTEVWELAKEIGVPDWIIKKVPSAGLWKGQTDEGELQISYKELDEVLIRLEHGKEVFGEKAERVKMMIEKSKHKLSLPPIFQPKKDR